MSFDVQVKSKLLETDGKIRYAIFRDGGHEHYNIKIYVEGPDEDLDRIERVEYLLHPTFRRRRRVSTERADGFPLELWAWGMFDIEVTFELKDGTSERTSYYLRFSLPDDTGTNYVRVE